MCFSRHSTGETIETDTEALKRLQEENRQYMDY